MSTRVIPEILAEHFETSAFLWKLWAAALMSPEYNLNDLGRLEERLEAHLGGLHEGKGEAISLARERLLGDDPAESFAAAYFLLLVGEKHADAAGAVFEAFQQAEGAQLVALREALIRAPVTSLLPRLRELLAASRPAVAVAAAEILAIRNSGEPAARRLQEFFLDEDPSVRANAWRVVAILDSVQARTRAASREEPAAED